MHSIQFAVEEAKNFGFDDEIIAKFTIPGTSVVEFHVDDYDFNRDKIDFGGKRHQLTFIKMHNLAHL